MDSAAFVKGFKNIRNGVKRTAERASVEVRKAVGLSPATSHDFPEYDHLCTEYRAQTKNLDTLHHDALSAYEAIQRAAGTAYTLAAKLRDSLTAGSQAFVVADALCNVHASIVDDVLPRVELRVKKRVVDPAKDELLRAKQAGRHMEERNRCLLDASRYGERIADYPNPSAEDSRKAEEKNAELEQRTNELVVTIRDAIRRRAVLVQRIVAETMEFQRRFYTDSSRALERAVETVGVDTLAGLRATTDETPAQQSTTPSNSSPMMPDLGIDTPPVASKPVAPTPIASQPKPKHAASMPVNPIASNQYSSIWNELDDDDHENDILNDPMPSYESPAASFDTSTTSAYPSRKESRPTRNYPSSGVGKRESVGGYPTIGVGQKESLTSFSASSTSKTDTSYPSRARQTAYPQARSRSNATKPPPRPTNPFAPSSSRESEKAKRRTEIEADLLGFDDPPRPQPRRSKRTASPAGSVEDLLDLGGPSKPMSKSASTTGLEGDLLGDLGSTAAKSRTKTSRTRNPPPPVPSSSAPAMGTSKPAMGTSNPSMGASKSAGSTRAKDEAERKRLKKIHDAEIKARADEKLAAVRKREMAEAKEREQKDDARGNAERRINQWTGNGTRRGNLRALLASLDTVLYPGATWKAVSMDVLKQNSKVKVNYHKAILQVHPDKINSKNLPPDQQVLAELVFDELKNGYEVWTAEQDGRPPPPGSVGPKGGLNTGSGFGRGGMGGMSNMYSNMGGMGGMGMGRGMGRGMAGMGMGGMGRGMGMGYGATGRGMGGMSMGMNGRGMGRRGTFGR